MMHCLNLIPLRNNIIMPIDMAATLTFAPTDVSCLKRSPL
uniref:Uncharacterized protein n=1 Tax=Arundo donax TaxID=35708 RepID=A0A0A9A687_ARUDO